MIANLDEFVSTFRKRQDIINDQFDKYLNNKTYFKDLMTEYILFIFINYSTSHNSLQTQVRAQIEQDLLKNLQSHMFFIFFFHHFLNINLAISPNNGIFLNICLNFGLNHKF